LVQDFANERDLLIEEAMEWLLRLEESPLDGRLKQEFQAWLDRDEAHREAYRSVRLTWSALGKLPHERPVGEGAPGAVIPLPRRKRQRMAWIAAVAAVAAACVTLAAFPVIQNHILADHLTGVAELRQVTLPDGSIAWLDAGSAIAVDYDRSSRGVSLLAGQAFFDVEHAQGQPFRVTADEVTVEVTGTAFNVLRTPVTVAVTVQSGTVEVVAGNHAPNYLAGGDRLVFDRQSRSVERDQVPADLVASWRTRRLVVHDTRFGDIVEELGRHFPGMIVVPDGSLNLELITGVFDVSHPLDALGTLADSQRASLTRITPYLVIVSRR